MITDRSTYPGKGGIKKSMKEERKIKKQGVQTVSVKKA
jgi:hypothetical protein